MIFACHAYPRLTRRLSCRRTSHDNIHVRGCEEEGNLITPFDMTVLNDLDRFHLVMDVIDRAAPADDRRDRSPVARSSRGFWPTGAQPRVRAMNTQAVWRNPSIRGFMALVIPFLVNNMVRGGVASWCYEFTGVRAWAAGGPFA